MYKLEEFIYVYKYIWQNYPDLALAGLSLSLMLGGFLGYLIAG